MVIDFECEAKTRALNYLLDLIEYAIDDLQHYPGHSCVADYLTDLMMMKDMVEWDIVELKGGLSAEESKD